jgi:hypothetical protein
MGFVLGAVVLVVVGAVCAGLRRNRRAEARARSLMALAGRVGLSYSAVDLFHDAWQPFPLFGLGTQRGVENVVYGTLEGIEVRAFDYWYRTEDPSPLRTDALLGAAVTRYSCAGVGLAASCPPLVVQRHDATDRLLELVEGDLVELDLEDFNRRFAVRSPDRRFAMALLDQRMMAAVLTLPGPASIVVAEDRLLLVAPGLPVDGVEDLLRAAARVAAAVPHVLASLYPLRAGFRPQDRPPVASDAPRAAAALDRAGEPSDTTGLWWF